MAKKKQIAGQTSLVFEDLEELQEESKYLAYKNAKTNFLRTFEIVGKNITLFPVYSPGEIISVPPKYLNGHLISNTPDAFMSYRESGNKKGTGVYFSTNMTLDDVVILAAKLEKKLDHRLVQEDRVTQLKAPKKVFTNIGEQTDIDFNIQTVLAESARPYAKEILTAIRQDVKTHCNKPAKVKLVIDDHVKFVPKIKPVAKITPMKGTDNKINRGGKGMFYKGCLYDRGGDVSIGCAVNTDKNGLYDPSKVCKICYAKRFAVKPVTSTILQFTKEQYQNALINGVMENGLSKKKIIHNRIGQDSEPIMPEHIQSMPGFINGLDVMLDGLIDLPNKWDKIVRTGIVSKFPIYNDELAEKIIKANAVLGVSLGYALDGAEQGAVEAGSTVNFRLEGARKFAEAGVPTFYFLVTDMSRPMSDMQDDAKRTLDYFEKYKHSDTPLYLQFLEGRIIGKDVANLIGGASWDILKNQEIDGLELDAFTGKPVQEFGHGGRWAYDRQTLVPKVMHQDFKDLVGKNKGDIRACFTSEIAPDFYCGKCFMDKTIS